MIGQNCYNFIYVFSGLIDIRHILIFRFEQILCLAPKKKGLADTCDGVLSEKLTSEDYTRKKHWRQGKLILIQ